MQTYLNSYLQLRAEVDSYKDENETLKKLKRPPMTSGMTLMEPTSSKELSRAKEKAEQLEEKIKELRREKREAEIKVGKRPVFIC